MSTAKPKVEVFLEMLRRSGLVEKDRLQAFVSHLKRSAPPGLLTDSEYVGQAIVDAELLTRWQCDRILEGRYRKFFLGKYKLLDHLGSGGMSKVYLAEHVLLQRRVAIKVLPQNRVEDASYLARFQREAQAAAALDHPNIVRAYDVDHDGDIHYLVMEFIQGRDLQRIVHEDGPLKFTAAAEYIRQAALGLGHAHKAGLIHRDIKPANLLVDRNNTVKLLDLGLARFAGGEEKASLTLSRDENVLGTADYLAPEQARDSHRVDLRADIYSLGCSLYYLLTGRPPFAEGTLPQRLMAHQRQEPPSIYDRRPDAPPELVEICLRMMAKKPTKRYQSAEEVARALDEWLAANRRPGDSLPGGSSGSMAVVSAVRSQSASGMLSGNSSGSSPRSSSISARLRVAPTEETMPDVQPAPTQVGRETPAGKARREKQLLVAKPLDDATFDEFLAQMDTTSILPQVNAARPAGRNARRTQGTPLWLWALIGAGALLALGMMLFYVHLVAHRS